MTAQTALCSPQGLVFVGSARCASSQCDVHAQAEASTCCTVGQRCSDGFVDAASRKGLCGALRFVETRHCAESVCGHGHSNVWYCCTQECSAGFPDERSQLALCGSEGLSFNEMGSCAGMACDTAGKVDVANCCAAREQCHEGFPTAAAKAALCSQNGLVFNDNARCGSARCSQIGQKEATHCCSLKQKCSVGFASSPSREALCWPLGLIFDETLHCNGLSCDTEGRSEVSTCCATAQQCRDGFQTVDSQQALCSSHGLIFDEAARCSGAKCNLSGRNEVASCCAVRQPCSIGFVDASARHALCSPKGLVFEESAFCNGVSCDTRMQAESKTCCSEPQRCRDGFATVEARSILCGSMNFLAEDAARCGNSKCETSGPAEVVHCCDATVKRKCGAAFASLAAQEALCRPAGLVFVEDATCASAQCDTVGPAGVSPCCTAAERCADGFQAPSARAALCEDSALAFDEFAKCSGPKCAVNGRAETGHCCGIRQKCNAGFVDVSSREVLCMPDGLVFAESASCFGMRCKTSGRAEVDSCCKKAAQRCGAGFVDKNAQEVLCNNMVFNANAFCLGTACAEIDAVSCCTSAVSSVTQPSVASVLPGLSGSERNTAKRQVIDWQPPASQPDPSHQGLADGSAAKASVGAPDAEANRQKIDFGRQEPADAANAPWAQEEFAAEIAPAREEDAAFFRELEPAERKSKVQVAPVAKEQQAPQAKAEESTLLGRMQHMQQVVAHSFFNQAHHLLQGARDRILSSKAPSPASLSSEPAVAIRPEAYVAHSETPQRAVASLTGQIAGKYAETVDVSHLPIDEGASTLMQESSETSSRRESAEDFKKGLEEVSYHRRIYYPR
eukprot:gnl/TRDRNA2_/TRDRNA2_152036_c0_seq1.p1 gnl/TRDRNA2_/TRDRNA2_152036_c0~~gnl/TRDRNA2_/TRDRNA2_152036_c0_seq1.p1  ORF type:complete len:938 (-),score=164.78 gnl/TRDRNA2_/TRDRNA2_152036_c0_seq1:102-2645(-)